LLATTETFGVFKKNRAVTVVTGEKFHIIPLARVAELFIDRTSPSSLSIIGQL
jgi:hypothetical protein